eukprot:gene16868-20039_t
MAGLKKALDERRSDLMRYKEQLAASLERERDAQRQLVQLRLRSESDLDEQTASAAVENEKLIKSLTEQRDSTVALLKEAQARADKAEAEAGLLKAEHRWEGGHAGGGAMGARGVGTCGNGKPGSARGGGPPGVLPPMSLAGLVGDSFMGSPVVSPTGSLLNSPDMPATLRGPAKREEDAGPAALTQYKIKVADLEAQNDRLRSVIGHMRAEMETLQQGIAGGAADGTASSSAVAMATALAERQALEAEVHHLQSHVEILTRNTRANKDPEPLQTLMAAEAGGAPSSPRNPASGTHAGTAGEMMDSVELAASVEELPFLRSRCKELHEETGRQRRELRRQRAKAGAHDIQAAHSEGAHSARARGHAGTSGPAGPEGAPPAGMAGDGGSPGSSMEAAMTSGWWERLTGGVGQSLSGSWNSSVAVDPNAPGAGGAIPPVPAPTGRGDVATSEVQQLKMETLEAELEQARWDIGRLMDERERLLEMTASLRAQLHTASATIAQGPTATHVSEGAPKVRNFNVQDDSQAKSLAGKSNQELVAVAKQATHNVAASVRLT